MSEQDPTYEFEKQKYAGAYYFISKDAIEKRGLDFVSLVKERRCNTCTVKMSKNSYKETNSTVQQEIEELAKCCASKGEFLSPYMPLKESLFRMMLKVSNRPMSLIALHWEITEELASPTHPMAMSIGHIKRILDRDQYYGFLETAGKKNRARKT